MCVGLLPVASNFGEVVVVWSCGFMYKFVRSVRFGAGGMTIEVGLVSSLLVALFNGLCCFVAFFG